MVGASAGIGRDAAIRLAELGFALAVSGRRKDRLDEVAAATGATPIAADLADPDQCERLVSEAAGALGGIDLIVHAASESRLRLLRDADSAEWSRVLSANVIGPALVVRAAVPHLAAGSVVCLLSSETVGGPYPGIVPYTVSKAGLEELTRGLRAEHPEFRFCCLRVGATIGTDFARDFDVDLAGELLPRWIAMGKIPARMMGAKELGRALADLLAVAVRSPGLDIQDVVIRAPGGPYLGDAASMTDRMASQAEQPE